MTIAHAEDEYIEQLTPLQRAHVSCIWFDRAAAERCVADAFTVIGKALRELQAAPTLIEMAERAVEDELAHAELCRQVAARYAGRDVPPVTPAFPSVPQHRGATPELRLRLWVVGQCCFNETLASSFLESSLAVARAPVAREVFRALLRDEIDHARIGWAFLAAQTTRQRSEIAPWLPDMLIANLKMWKPLVRDRGFALSAHGILSPAEVQSALRTAVDDMILPGLERVALRAGPIDVATALAS